MAAKRQRLSGQLRDAIVNAEITRYRISQETGISEAGLSRFVNGTAGLSLESIDKIGQCLNLEIVANNQNDKRKGT
ncbi:MAG: helix-turn-helix transcriptional regulator [Planctomycetota bacterium]|nr:helix-turn-helix transcriptional regulator [Planctomycetota bacterium]